MLQLPHPILLSSLNLGEFMQDCFSDITFSSVANLSDAQPQSLVFVFQDGLCSDRLGHDYALCLIDKKINVKKSLLKSNTIEVSNARLLLQKVLSAIEARFQLNTLSATGVISPVSVISPSAQIGPNVTVGPFCHIEDHVTIKAGSVLGTGVHIQKGSVIGEDCRVHSHVFIGKHTCVGERVVIGPHSSLGAAGFGFEKDDTGHWQEIPHLAGVRIDSDCFIGSQVCIDAGILKPTHIEQNVIIDNLVQIAHHVRIGQSTAIAGCVGIAGSTSIGENCMVGGGSGIVGHIAICDGVIITGMSMVTSSIKTPGVYSSGIPVDENQHWRRNAATFTHLARLRKDIQQIKKELGFKALSA